MTYGAPAGLTTFCHQRKEATDYVCLLYTPLLPLFLKPLRLPDAHKHRLWSLLHEYFPVCSNAVTPFSDLGGHHMSLCEHFKVLNYSFLWVYAVFTRLRTLRHWCHPQGLRSKCECWKSVRNKFKTLDTRLRSAWADHMAGNTRFQGNWRISGLEGLSDPTTYFSRVKILATISPPSIYPDWVRTPPGRGNAGSLSSSFIYGLFWLIDMCLSMTLSCLCVITLHIF